ncbi:unnamed protein product [Orchesella dallaii]|uniref:Endothelin-converting enzyme 1 n=1 Tax=Orchesella dallaii TaxID=48710 RepID=A0ABP1RZP5_9HEXA
MKEKLRVLVGLLPILLLLLADPTFSRRHSRRGTETLEEWQRHALEKIELLAREGGLPEEERKGITKFDKDVCYEKGCLDAALEFMTSVNFTVDPCKKETWMNFVCSRRVKGPDNINQVERLAKVADVQIQEILDGVLGAKELKDDFLFKEAQTYYHQCKNKADNDKEDVKNVLKFLSKCYGNWPILTGEDPGELFSWSNMVADINNIERYGFTPLIFKISMPNEFEGPHIVLSIGQTSFGTINSNDLKNFFQRVHKTAQLTEPYRHEQIEQMLYFQNSLNQVSISESPVEDLSLEKLQAKTDEFFAAENIEPSFNWVEFFQKVLSRTDIKVTQETKIKLPFQTVMNVLMQLDMSDPIALANVLNFQLASVLLQESTSLLDDMNAFKCTEETGPRETICLERTKQIFGYSLGKSFIKMTFNEAESRPFIEDLMSKIKQGYIDVISENEWMADTTKDFLKDKIKSMVTHIAQPNWLKEGGIESLKKFYEKLEASADKNSSYPINFLKVNSWMVDKKRAYAWDMSKRTDYKNYSFYDSEWSRYLGTVQAQYHKGINQVRIDAGIIQSPLFNLKAPGFMNYGGLGTVLGHEIGHSFDQQGRTFDKNGIEGEYWDPKSKAEYRKWVLDLAWKYGEEVHYITENLSNSIDPMKTIDDDIADVLGVHIGFLSYKEYLKALEADGKREKILPGMKSFAPQKLFYMKYANMWCDDKDIQDKYNDLLSDHSPGNTRATMPLLLSNEFAETFGCPKRS